eukprot:6488563-Ditylum_brightwellii.AAC.1
MTKIGWKYTNQEGDKSKKKLLKHSNTSSKLRRKTPKQNGSNMKDSKKGEHSSRQAVHDG